LESGVRIQELGVRIRELGELSHTVALASPCAQLFILRDCVLLKKSE